MHTKIGKVSLKGKEWTIQGYDILLDTWGENWCLQQIASHSNGAVSLTDLHRTCRLRMGIYTQNTNMDTGLSTETRNYTSNFGLQLTDILGRAGLYGVLSAGFFAAGRGICGSIKHETLVRSKAMEFGRNAGLSVGVITFGIKLLLNWYSKKRVDEYLENCPATQVISVVV